MAHPLLGSLPLITSSLFIESLALNGYCVIDDWLAQRHYQGLQLLADITYKRNCFNPAKIGPSEQAIKRADIRRDSILWLDPFKDNEHVIAYYKALGKLIQVLNAELFLGIQHIEAHFAVYAPGTFYKKHVDQFLGKYDRKISCVYYLNEDWHTDYGGELTLYQKNNPPQSITPIGNRLVCFCSDMLHEVMITHKKRISIASWLKSRTMTIIE